MLKFKFNYLHNTLAIHQAEDIWTQILEENQFEGQFGSSGFKLQQGWITFSIYEKRIRAFYKQITSHDPTDFWEPQEITYFRKDLPKECPVIFQFNETDEVEKINGKWRRKHA